MLAGIGTKIDHYVLLRELGTGGMGRVFEASHVDLGKRVALKLLHPNLAASENAVRRFLREGRACSRIRHPHVVEIWDVGIQHGQPYLVMDLVEGTSLSSLLRERGSLGVTELVDVFLPLCSAIWAAHQNGVVHRDLKPANVLLTYPRPNVVHPVIVDFGVSRLLFSEATDDVTRTGAQVGTAAYMAPEQTRAAREAEPASDQWALGVMLYECATGRRPFTGESDYELMHAILHAAVAPPTKLRPELPPEIDEIVLRAISRDPAARYPSVHALGSALLTLAGTRAWALWGSEFCATEAETGGTRADVTRTSSEQRSSRPDRDVTANGASAVPVSSPPAARGFGKAALMGAALGGLVFLALSRSGAPNPNSGEPQASPPLLPASPQQSVATQPSANRSQADTALSRAQAAPSGLEPAPAAPVTIETRRALRTTAHPKRSELATRSSAPAASVAPPRPEHPSTTSSKTYPPVNAPASKRAVQRGTNNAPILE